MAESKYANLLHTVKYEGRDEWFSDSDSEYRTLFGPGMYCKDTDPNAPIFIDIMQLFKKDTGFGLGATTIMHGEEIVDTPHKHECPEIFVFCGTDPQHPEDIGGTIEFWIGEGEEAEKFEITEPTFVYLPPNVVHQPTWLKECHGNVLCMNILMQGDMNIQTVDVYPPAYEGPARFAEHRAKYRDAE